MELDLSGILTPEALARLRLKESQTKAKRSITAKPDVPVRPKARPSPWIAEAAILVETVVTCSCGTSWSIPASEEPLVRFRHKRRGDLWEIAQHPSLHKPGLPKETRQIFGTCHACPNCWLEEETIEVALDQDTQH